MPTVQADVNGWGRNGAEHLRKKWGCTIFGGNFDLNNFLACLFFSESFWKKRCSYWCPLWCYALFWGGNVHWQNEDGINNATWKHPFLCGTPKHPSQINQRDLNMIFNIPPRAMISSEEWYDGQTETSSINTICVGLLKETLSYISISLILSLSPKKKTIQMFHAASNFLFTNSAHQSLTVPFMKTPAFTTPRHHGVQLHPFSLCILQLDRP